MIEIRGSKLQRRAMGVYEELRQSHDGAPAYGQIGVKKVMRSISAAFSLLLYSTPQPPQLFRHYIFRDETWFIAKKLGSHTPVMKSRGDDRNVLKVPCSWEVWNQKAARTHGEWQKETDIVIQMASESALANHWGVGASRSRLQAFSGRRRAS